MQQCPTDGEITGNDRGRYRQIATFQQCLNPSIHQIGLLMAKGAQRPHDAAILAPAVRGVRHSDHRNGRGNAESTQLFRKNGIIRQ